LFEAAIAFSKDEKLDTSSFKSDWPPPAGRLAQGAKPAGVLLTQPAAKQRGSVERKSGNDYYASPRPNDLNKKHMMVHMPWITPANWSTSKRWQDYVTARNDFCKSHGLDPNDYVKLCDQVKSGMIEQDIKRHNELSKLAMRKKRSRDKGKKQKPAKKKRAVTKEESEEEEEETSESEQEEPSDEEEEVPSLPDLLPATVPHVDVSCFTSSCHLCGGENWLACNCTKSEIYCTCDEGSLMDCGALHCRIRQ
jgi:hypothetical protein